jgi:protein-S-isoprenylcysteine O-methyltransferase Ste14
MNHFAGYLWVYFVVYAGVVMVWRSVSIYRATGLNPMRLPATDDAQGYVGRMFKAVLALCFVYLTALTLGWPSDEIAPPMAWLDKAYVRTVGWGILVVSGLGVFWAQRQMGVSWRIGLDADTPGPLVTHGLFARSRNPIFLSMRLNLWALLCLLPNTLTLLLLVCGELLIQIQVRLEEAHLPLVYGQAYDNYCAKVPRWW